MRLSNFNLYNYVKNKSYIGISFVILVLNLCHTKILDRIQDGAVVKGDRLIKINAVAKLNGN
jgi:hypothetical protein